MRRSRKSNRRESLPAPGAAGTLKTTAPRGSMSSRSGSSSDPAQPSESWHLLKPDGSLFAQCSSQARSTLADRVTRETGQFHMQIHPTSISAVLVLTPRKHGDHRGFFSEVYRKELLSKQGIDVEFVQDNHSLSAEKGTVRGLHFQAPPFAQDKLVRVVRGAVFDVAVDIRPDSPTYGRHVGVVLSAEAWNQVYVPIGFAHGFMTLEPDTEVVYKVSDYYAPDHERGALVE